MDFSFVIANVLPQPQPAESFFVWWRVLSWIIIVVCPLCLARYYEKDNKYETKDYLVLGGIFCAFIFITPLGIPVNSILPPTPKFLNFFMSPNFF